MKRFSDFLSLAVISGATWVTSARGQFILSGTSYSQNFNGIGTALPANWTVNSGATAVSPGTSQTFSTSAISWGDSTNAFKNFAATTGLASGATTGAQSGSIDRALGIRQTATSGYDPGAAFVFNFNSIGRNLSSITVDLMMLSVQTRSTTWTIDYGIGASPTSFTPLTTWSDPGAFGSTSITLSSGLAGLSNQSNVTFRIVALSAATGSGSRDSMGIDNFALNYSAVPEPATYATILGTIVILSAAWKRRRQRSGA